MDTRSIAIVLLKITGLVLVVISVSRLPGYFSLTGGGYDFSMGEVLATVAVGLGPLAVLGLLLWFFPGTVANKIVSGAPTTAVTADVQLLELVALTILGVYLVADGIIGAIHTAVLLIFIQRQDIGTVPAAVFANIAAMSAELVIGAALCVGAKGALRFIEGLRG